MGVKSHGGKCASLYVWIVDVYIDIVLIFVEYERKVHEGVSKKTEDKFLKWL